MSNPDNSTEWVCNSCGDEVDPDHPESLTELVGGGHRHARCAECMEDVPEEPRGTPVKTYSGWEMH